MHLALCNHDLDIINELLKHPDIDVNAGRRTDSMSNCTCLHFAAEFGQLEIVKALLAAGANVNALTSLKISPLLFAAKNNYIDICKLLLEVCHQLHASVFTSQRLPLCVCVCVCVCLVINYLEN